MGRGRLAVFIVGAATIAAATFACRQLVGIGNDPPQGLPATSTDSGEEGGFTYGQRACAACVATSCEAQASTCAGTPSCAALEGCMSGCGTDPTCRAQCGVDHGLGNDGVTPAFEACLASSCADACGITCGGLAATFPPATAPACQACIAQGECPSVTDCATDAGCQTAVRCQFSSGTFDVWQTCPAIVPSTGALSASPHQNPPIARTCSTECSWGADWSCVGHVNWPPARLGPLQTTAYLFDTASQAPVEDATVKLCNSADPACEGFFSTGTTGDAGTVLLPRKPVEVPVLMYLDVSSPAIDPGLLFDVFPISQPQVTVPMVAFPTGGNVFSAAHVGVALNSQLGTVWVSMFDCRLAPAPGVQFALSPLQGAAGPFYLVGGLTSTTTSVTDGTGVGAFFNVPVDVVDAGTSGTELVLTVTTPAPGRELGRMPFFARAGAYSFVYALPTSPP